MRGIAPPFRCRRGKFHSGTSLRIFALCVGDIYCATFAEGCQILFEAKKKSLVLEGVNFATGKAELTPESQAILDGVAESLVAHEDLKVQGGGHTDNTGSAAVNKRLSAARAEAVRQYLISKGVSAGRLTARGYGPSKPIASNKTA